MDKPNIIFILIDDMGWKDLSCYGSEFYETPNVDKLCCEGMMFTDAYAAAPVCSPTRASLMSGKYPTSVGVTDWIDESGQTHPCKGVVMDAPYVKHLSLEEDNIAKMLKREGYRTWHVGKWHLGEEAFYPDKQGFDINIGGSHIGSPGEGGYFSPWNIPNLPSGPEGEYLTDRLTNEAIKLIEGVDEVPFFLNLWYYSVHTPIQAKAAYIQKFEQKRKAMGLDKQTELEECEYFPTDHKKDKRVIRRRIQSDSAYAAMIYSLDENIGRLLESVKAAGMENNTMVVFSSDNGGLATAEGSPTCNAPLSEGKGWMYDGGVREPLIVKWPKVIEAGSKCHIPVSSPDFKPTFGEVAGVSDVNMGVVDGESFFPMLKGQKEMEGRPLFWHYPHYGNQGGTPGSSIRYGDYKLIEFYEDNRMELYNLKEDIEEKHNLVGLEVEKREALYTMLEQWKRDKKVRLPQRIK